MRTPLVLLVSALLGLGTTLTGCAPEGDGDAAAGEASMSAGPTFDDPEVERVWTRMMDTLAPGGGWSDTRYVQFDWMVGREEGEPLRRSHRWDVWEGDYRVEAPVNGQRMVALFNVNDPTGTERVWLDGEPVEDPARSDSLAERAHAMFVNDSYWLLMPYKWDDPGVHARHLGEMEEWGETWDVVELTFDDVGLTPQNKYRAFVDPESGMMGLWQHYREASDSAPSFTLAWTDWERHGPIMLSTRRPDQEGDSRIWFENVDASREVPAGAFEPPRESGTPGDTVADEASGAAPEGGGARDG